MSIVEPDVFSISGKQRYVHRISWELVHGAIPSGLHVCHDCDVSLCMRPTHLFLGTQQENMLDMKAKGRHLYGERNFSAKLTGAQVLELRKLHVAGYTFKYLSNRFGISASQAHHIVHNKCWKVVA